jgi:hypothetical protein
MKECEKWLFYKNFYDHPSKQYIFEPNHRIDGKPIHHRLVLDTDRKSFNHDVYRVMAIINTFKTLNTLNMKDIIESLDVYMCPKYDLQNANACAYKNYITFFAKSTQIPTFMTDYVTVHELGHVFMFNKFSKHENKELLREYLRIRNAPRGLCKVQEYNDSKNKWEEKEKEDFLYIGGDRLEQNPSWDEDPYEWFAEDFRYLFGIDKEKYWGLPIPKPDDTVYNFINSLV